MRILATHFTHSPVLLRAKRHNENTEDLAAHMAGLRYTHV